MSLFQEIGEHHWPGGRVESDRVYASLESAHFANENRRRSAAPSGCGDFHGGVRHSSPILPSPTAVWLRGLRGSLLDDGLAKQAGFDLCGRGLLGHLRRVSPR